MWSGILEFLGGLGLFLFGMEYFEKAILAFSKGGFKKLLKKFTSNNFSSLLTGIFATVIVQSSNLVSVLVLAFVGTGILSLTAALAVILGANIGTTIPDAILGSIGLNYDIKILTFPLIFLGAIGVTFFSRYEKVSAISKSLIGLALIFLALSFMKGGLVFLTDMVDLSSFMDMSPWVFFGIGLLMTLLVQSGGATFIVALTSVSSGLITSDAAFPIILGSYLGSTITIVLGALGNQPAIKKQVAAGHVGFNFLVSLVGMIFLGGIEYLFQTWIFPLWGEITGLSIFYVGFRTLMALVVFPFLGWIAHLFQTYITDKKDNFHLSIQRISSNPIDTEMGLLAVKQDLLILMREAVGYNLNIWDFYLTDISSEEEDFEKITKRTKSFGKNHLKEEYQDIKEIQEQLLQFLVKLNQNKQQNSEETEEITNLYQVIIDIGDSSKYLKDVWDRVEDRQWSTSEELQRDYDLLRKMVLNFYKSVLKLLMHFGEEKHISMVHNLLERIKKNDKKYMKLFDREEVDDIDLANLIQVNRYFSMSCLSLVKAIEGIVLSPEEIKYMKEHISPLL